MFGFFKSKEGPERLKRPERQGIDGATLDAHLCSIKNCLMELVNYKKKRYAPSPTHVYWRAVDIEETWDSMKEPLADVFRVLCVVSAEVHTPHTVAFPETGIHDALQSILDLVEEIGQCIRNRTETKGYSAQELNHIDDEILHVQHLANKINKYITKDFKYSM